MSNYNSSCETLERFLFRDNYKMSLVGLCLAILMSFIERRQSFRSNTCFGRPGALVPINLINGDQNVLAHAAAFGCVVMNILYAFSLGSENSDGSKPNPWLETFVSFVRMMNIGLQYYPLFVCVEYGSKNIIAPIVGLLYAVALLAMIISVLVFCRDDLLIALILPVLGCLLFLCIKFIRNLCTKLREFLNGDLPNGKSHGGFSLTGSRCQRYVKVLFIADKSDNDDMKRNKNKIAMFLSRQKTCLQTELVHRCSNRMLSIFFLLGMMIYEWFVISVYVATFYQKYYRYIKDVYGNTSVQLDDYLLTFLRVCIGSYYTGAFVATIVMIFNMVKLYSSHRKHIHKLLAGNKDFIPEKCWNMEPHTILARNIMYPGMQIGFFIWGFLLNLFTVVIVCIILSYFLILPLIDRRLDILLTPVRTLLPPFITAILFRIAFFFFINVFLQEKVVEEGDDKVTTHKVLALDNWRAYHNVSYFMFFFYILLSAFWCFWKILLSGEARQMYSDSRTGAS